MSVQQTHDIRKRRRIIVATIAVAAVATAGVAWGLAGSNGGTEDALVQPPAATEPATPTDEGDRGGDEEPHPCDNPPSSFPGEVTWGQSGPAALAWQRLLVSFGHFNYADVNCDSSYSGEEQKSVVVALRDRLGLGAANGLLDEPLYSCLVHNGCSDTGDPCPYSRVPDVAGWEVREAQSVLEASFAVQVEREPTESAPPGTVTRQRPEAGANVCEGTTVTITVAVPSTPEPTTRGG